MTLQHTLPKALLLLLWLSFGCSSSPQEAAQSSINAYLAENLRDKDSYEPVATSPIKSYTGRDSLTYLYPLLAEQGQVFEDSLQARLLRQEYYMSQGQWDQAAQVLQLVRADSAQGTDLLEQIAKAKNATDTTRIGYQVTHQYRAKNLMNQTVLNEAVFLLDDQYQVKYMLAD